VSVQPFQEKFYNNFRSGWSVITSHLKCRWDGFVLQGCPKEYSSQQKGQSSTW
jgi:hypothetical protein